MHVSLPIRIAFIVIAILAVFWFPWPLTILCIFAAGLVFPPAAFAIGILADLLYYPGHGFLWGSAWGLVLMLLALAVRHFVKTRIM